MNIAKKFILNLIFAELKKCVLEDRRLMIHIAKDRKQPPNGYTTKTILSEEGAPDKFSIVYIGIHPKLFKKYCSWLDQAAFKYRRLYKCLR